MSATLRVGSLFSGIGGLDLGLERAGMTVVWQSEIDPYASRVLAKHWPTIPNHGDITQIDWSSVEDVDVLCGGYPCQPFSLTGKRTGAADPRHLWPHFLAAIRELRPRHALMENVRGHLSLGFGTVLADLASCGYDAEWDCLPASAVGAHHQRDRVFIVAHANSVEHEGRSSEVWRSPATNVPADPDRLQLRHEPVGELRRNGSSLVANDGVQGDVADASRKRVRAGLREGQPYAWDGPVFGDCGGVGGTWPAEPDVRRVAYGVPDRVDRLKGLGNAVVPQVAELVGRRIMAVAA